MKIVAESLEFASAAIIQPPMVKSVNQTAAKRYVEIGHQNFGLP